MKVKVAVVLAIVALLQGCGSSSSTNNDQGVSFTLLGFFSNSATASGGACNGGSGNLLTTVNSPISSSDETVTSESAVNVQVGVQNNLAGQTVRVDRALIQYFVPGSDVQPPATTVGVSGTLGPTSVTGVTTSLPGSLSTLCNARNLDISVVPPAIREFINFNRDSFPETPFNMEVTVEMSGQSSAGDRLVSNQQTLVVRFTTDTVIAPSAPASETPEATVSTADSDISTEVVK